MPCFLIVEDDPLARIDLREIVEESGFEVYEAANTAEALSILAAAPTGFIGMITDVQMPGTRSGLVLANHVRALWPHIKVIVVSGGRKPLPGELPKEVTYLSKPVAAGTLGQAIHAG